MHTEERLESYNIIGEITGEGAFRVPSCCSLLYLKETFYMLLLFPNTPGIRLKTKSK